MRKYYLVFVVIVLGFLASLAFALKTPYTAKDFKTAYENKKSVQPLPAAKTKVGTFNVKSNSNIKGKINIK